jgi:anthranilate synthase/aminodeoxychorismate synthase-like glutamine amidotransferase
MVLVIDNYDSFTYNLVQYLGELHAEPIVFRNDAISIDRIRALAPSQIVISPGPGTPLDAGISNEAILAMGSTTPLLGVCLGHQCICHVFGGRIVHAPRLMHGKTSSIQHDGTGVFNGLPNPFEATRYHSLIAEEASLPECLALNARANGDEIMGVRHKLWPIHGVQFHPESILTHEGKRLLKNFLELTVS